MNQTAPNRFPTRTRPILHRLAAGLLLAPAGLMAGCLISGHSHTQVQGQYIGSGTLDQIEPGRTRADFVRATLGTPTSQTELDDGTEIWKYSYRRTTSGSGTVFLLLNTSNSTEKSGAVYVMMKDGVVQKYWRD
jgi:outer membrane protein assembly factor BamE (lipoprotein component of BamABCDE complex)